MSEPSAAAREAALRIPAPCVCVETPLCNQHKAIALALDAFAAARVAEERERLLRVIYDALSAPFYGVTRMKIAAALRAPDGEGTP